MSRTCITVVIITAVGYDYGQLSVLLQHDGLTHPSSVLTFPNEVLLVNTHNLFHH